MVIKYHSLTLYNTKGCPTQIYGRVSKL